MPRNPVQDIEGLEPRILFAALPDTFVQKNLVADVGGMHAAHIDTSLKNGWGISFRPGGPFWVSDNGTSKTTLYNGSGIKQSLVVNIPSAGADDSAPTGQVYNGTSAFELTNGDPALFIFVGEDGGITGWNDNSGTNAELVVDHSAQGAIYKGVAIATNGSNPLLYAADFHNKRIDVFKSDFSAANLSGHFTDSKLPAGFAPFNIQQINGNLFVAFAKTGSGPDEVDGPGLGYVDEFSPQGKLVKRFPHVSRLNAPWGFAEAPSTFGPFANDLLVGQFGSGKILAYDFSGKFDGVVRDLRHKDIVVPGLWGITFGNGGQAGSVDKLYFAAGPSDEADGLFGSLSFKNTSVAPATGGGGGTTSPYAMPMDRASLFSELELT